MEFKRHQKVRIHCDMEGIIKNKIEDNGYRVSVKLPGHKYTWWIIVPEEFIEEVK